MFSFDSNEEICKTHQNSWGGCTACLLKCAYENVWTCSFLQLVLSNESPLFKLQGSINLDGDTSSFGELNQASKSVFKIQLIQIHVDYHCSRDGLCCFWQGGLCRSIKIHLIDGVNRVTRIRERKSLGLFDVSQIAARFHQPKRIIPWQQNQMKHLGFLNVNCQHSHNTCRHQFTCTCFLIKKRTHGFRCGLRNCEMMVTIRVWQQLGCQMLKLVIIRCQTWVHASFRHGLPGFAAGSNLHQLTKALKFEGCQDIILFAIKTKYEARKTCMYL